MKIYHLLLSAKNKQYITHAKLREVLQVIPDLMGMLTLGPLVIEEGNKELPGYSGFQMIEFSHIALHTFDKEKEVWVDILSCRSFDQKKVIKYLKKEFKLSSIEVL